MDRKTANFCSPKLYFLSLLHFTLCMAAFWIIPRWWFVCHCCLHWYPSSVFFSFLLFLLSWRLHGWWKWVFPGLTPSRRSELQITISTWQPTSFCNTNKEISEEQRGKEQPKQSWEKMLERMTIFVQIIWRLCHCSLKLCQAELSPVTGWLMKKCEAQSGRHLRHSFLMAVVLWNRRHCSRQTSKTSWLQGGSFWKIHRNQNMSEFRHGTSK